MENYGFVSRAWKHIEYLAKKIGPRGSTSKEEALAADYVQGYLESSGFTPIRENFTSVTSAWWPASLGLGIALVSTLGFWFEFLPVYLSFLLSIITVVLILLEFSFLPNPLRWVLPKGQSSNVWAIVPSKEKAQIRVVLSAHLDTHRTPLVFSSPFWLSLFKYLIPLGLLFIILNSFFFGLNLFRDLTAYKYWLLIPNLFILFVFLLTLQPDFSPFVEGANDNASGVGVVLSLAEYLKTNPMNNVQVWIVFTGCEEVGSYGAEAFLQKHKEKLLTDNLPVYWFTYDSVGGKGGELTYIEKHTFLTTATTAPELSHYLKLVGEKNPDLMAKAKSSRSGYTDSHIAQKYGIKNITFLHLTPDGFLPFWHKLSDNLSNIDPQLVEKTDILTYKILSEMDKIV